MSLVLSPFVNYATAFHVTAVADLRSVVPPIAKMGAIIAGHTTAGDGGGGHFYWDASSTATDDDGTVLNPGLGSAPGRWLRIRVPGIYHAAWWGVAAGVGDNSTALANAIAAVVATGGTLVLPQGTLQHASTLVLDDCRNVTVEGTGIGAYPQNGSILKYTGTGTVAVSAKSALGISFKRLGFKPSSTFGGVILEFGHSTVGNDGGGITIHECWFQGGFVTNPSSINTIGIFLAYILSASIRDCWFGDLCYSILGTTNATSTPVYPGPSDYSQNVTISGGTFTFSPIRNPGLNWTIDGASVEGGAWPANAGNFIDQDSSEVEALNLCITNCTGGDFPSGDVWINLPNVISLYMGNCFWGPGTRALAVSGYNITVVGNDFDGTAIDFTGTTVGFTALGNRNMSLLHQNNANIGSTGAARLIAGNSGSGFPSEFCGAGTEVILPQGVQLGALGAGISFHGSGTVSSPSWSSGTVANGAAIHCTVPVTGSGVGDTCVVGLHDPAMPAGVVLSANVMTNGTATVTLLNMSGGSYTPSGALRVDIWEH